MQNIREIVLLCFTFKSTHIMGKYIYEMVTFEHIEPGYRVDYRYESCFFSSHKAAIIWVADYIIWAMKNGHFSEAIEMKYVSETKATEVLWKALKDGKVEYIGIKRHMILN